MKLTLVLAALISVVSLRANTLLSENFDELTAQLAVSSAGAFTTTGGTNIDIVGVGDGYGALCAAPASGNCIDLAGSGGNSQGILQSGFFTLDPGIDYFLSYDLLGSGRGLTTSATVTFGSYNRTFILQSSDITSGIVNNALITVGAETTTRLVFTGNTAGNVGTVLDNVQLTSAPVLSTQASLATPEPPSMALFIPGVLGALWLGSRRSRRLRQKLNRATS